MKQHIDFMSTVEDLKACLLHILGDTTNEHGNNYASIFLYEILDIIMKILTIIKMYV